MTSWVGCAKGVGAYSQRPVLVCVCFVCTGGKVESEDSPEGGGGGVKSERDKRDIVEQLLGHSLLSSAALTSLSSDYTTLFPYCILLQLNISMSVFLPHTLHLYLKV